VRLRACFPAGLLLIALAGCARTQQRPLHPTAPEGSFYIVGIETLSDIAKRQGIPLEDLAEINGLLPTSPLEPGQVIFVLVPEPGVAQAMTKPEDAPLPPNIDDLEPSTVSAAGFDWPLKEGQMSSIYGRRWGRAHQGIDLAAPLGTPIYAAKDGVVLYADNVVRGYGNMVVISHDGDLLTAYGHTSVLLVRKGDRVRRGQIIARVGQTGHATAPHLHFEIRQGQTPRDPLKYLPPRAP
jgi:murein DD-endopeptidase MepM/ murein hydrolase activator NlpD